MNLILKKGRIFSRISFMIIGLIFVAASIIGTATTSKYKGEGVAEIVNIVKSQEYVNYGEDSVLEDVYTQYITYEANGKKYENVEFGQCDDNAKIGDKIEIKYDENNPERVTTKSNSVLLVVGIAGGAVAAVSLASLVMSFVKKH